MFSMRSSPSYSRNDLSEKDPEHREGESRKEEKEEKKRHNGKSLEKLDFDISIDSRVSEKGEKIWQDILL
jgi:hypothetical protein